MSVTTNYTFIQAQPLYGYSEDRHEVSGGASIRFHENWRAFGSGTYDLQSNVLISDSLGLAYDDECFAYALTMSTSRDTDDNSTDERTLRVQHIVADAWRHWQRLDLVRTQHYKFVHPVIVTTANFLGRVIVSPQTSVIDRQ